jgi:hypothetical protein
MRLPPRHRLGKTSLLAILLGILIVGSAERPRALVVATFFGPSGVNCSQCDGGGLVELPTTGAPLQTLAGATWVVSPNGTSYAGGVKEGKPVNFRLSLNDINTRLGTTHFLIIFTTVTTGTKPGLLHVRDTSPGAKGNIKMVALPASVGDTGLVERVYRTPGADNVLQGDGSNTSTDPLPWDHAINSKTIDFALNMSDLDEGATWGLSAVVFGLHRMPCNCEPGAPQSLTNGCVPQNATDIAESFLPPLYSPPQVYCPSASSPFAGNSCGKKQPQAWSCAGVDDGAGGFAPLPFVCTVTGVSGKGNAIYTCASEAVVSQGIPASSCTYTAKQCP